MCKFVWWIGAITVLLMCALVSKAGKSVLNIKAPILSFKYTVVRWGSDGVDSTSSYYWQSSIFDRIILSLRCQSLGRPLPFCRKAIDKSVVQTVRSALPKLEGLRYDTVSAPIIRKRHFAVGEPALQLIELSLEDTS